MNIEIGSEMVDGFPLTRPQVTIQESSARLQEVDCPELQWWFAVPRLAEHCKWAVYEADRLELTEVVEIVSVGSATIRDIDCIELRVEQHVKREDIPLEFDPGYMYALLDDVGARWVGFTRSVDGKRVVEVQGDRHFEANWGGVMNRRMIDGGQYERQSDGSYKTTDGEGIGAGTYDVTIGDHRFHCLRVFDAIPGLSAPNGGELVEVFVEAGGRTVFFRRYDGRFFPDGDLVVKYPDNRRIVINDTVYVHHDCTGRAHDTITQFALQPARSEAC